MFVLSPDPSFPKRDHDRSLVATAPASRDDGLGHDRYAQHGRTDGARITL